MMAPITVVKAVRIVILFSIFFAVFLETVESGTTIYENNEGFVSSPMHLGTEEYPNNYQHSWLIRVRGHRIKLVFDFFELESSTNCTFDHVTIYDGEDTNSRVLGKFCSTELPPSLISTNEAIYIEFKTNRSVTKKGFRARYTSELNLKDIVSVETTDELILYFLKNKWQPVLTTNKWGTDITRATVALFLKIPHYRDLRKDIEEDIAYELTLQLKSKLIMNKQISTKDLALFINAMTLACINPKEFFGHNIVAELRKRVDNSNQTNPFFILALCIGGDNRTIDDVQKLQQLFDARLRHSWTATQAMVVMALQCISKQTNVTVNILQDMVAVLKRKQQNNGTIEDLKTTALVIQALIATESYKSNFNMSLAIKSILKDMKQNSLGTEEVYYFLPILNWKSLLSINSDHCENFIKTDLEEMMEVTQRKTDKRIQIQISVIVGDDMYFARTWKIKVPPNCTLYQALESISSSDPEYNVRYKILEGKPYISSLGNFQDSVEDELFWCTYTKPLTSAKQPIITLVEESPVDIEVSEPREFILWYRSERPKTLVILANTTDLHTGRDVYTTLAK